MSWNLRLRDGFLLVAPDGTEFNAKWRGDTREIARRVAIFSYPYINGNTGQDLGSESFIHPITLYFDGKDNDVIANDFINRARTNSGEWSVTHPIYGFRKLQLLRAKVYDEPITNGNITAIETEWIELIDEVLLKTGAELAGTVNGFATDLNESALDQYNRNLITDTEFDIAVIKNTARKIQDFADKTLKPLAELNADINSAFNSVQVSIQDTLTATIFEPLKLGAQFQQLTQLPLRATQDIKSRLNSYKNFASELLGISPEFPDNAGKNEATLQELNMVSTITANALISVDGSNEGFLVNGFISRPEAVDAAVTLNNNFNLIVDAMEESQALFVDQDLEDQFFSQTSSYNDSAKITSDALQFLVQTLYNLKFERKIVLKEFKTPQQITIEEYGSLGDEDSLYDLFISSNNLHGNEVYLLPPLKEVVVYA